MARDDGTNTVTSLPAVQGDKRKPFKRLTPRYMAIIDLHLSGCKGVEIAQILGTSSSRISFILSNPAVETYLQELRDAADEHLKNLVPLAVEVLRRALRDNDLNHGLRATDLIFKSQGLYQEAKSRSEITAEDVIQQALAIAKTSIDTVKEIAGPQPRIIDVTPDESTLSDREDE